MSAKVESQKSQIATELVLAARANGWKKEGMITCHQARKHHDNGRIESGQFYFNITGKRDVEYYTKQARNAGMSVGDFLSACVTDLIRKDAAGKS